MRRHHETTQRRSERDDAPTTTAVGKRTNTQALDDDPPFTIAGVTLTAGAGPTELAMLEAVLGETVTAGLREAARQSPGVLIGLLGNVAAEHGVTAVDATTLAIVQRLATTYSAWVRIEDALSQTAGPLTADAIGEARARIAELPAADRGPYYLALQERVTYRSQRDNTSTSRASSSETFASQDNMCNVTALAMVLEYLGKSNPDPTLQFEDYLEAKRISGGYGPRTDWHTLRAIAVAEFGVLVFDQLFSWQAISRQEWWSIVQPRLAGGASILLWTNGLTSGHYVRLQAVSETGLVVDDPYGLEQLGAGSQRKVLAKDGTSTSTLDDQGEDNRWAWKHVEPHVFKGVFAVR
jgi:hypothetical protein